jgi:hypothetical protein
MILEPKTKNAISLGGFLLGLTGIAYSLWALIIDSNLQAITLLLYSLGIIAGAAYLLIRENDQYPPGFDTEVRNITIFLWFMAMYSSGLFRRHTYLEFFAMGAIFMILLFFATIYEKLWRKRIR